MGTDFSLHFQGLSNPSSSECNIYLGNYEKSYNNVLFTAFIISLLGSECCLPPNHNQRRLGHLAARAGGCCRLRRRPHRVQSVPVPRPSVSAGLWEVTVAKEALEPLGQKERRDGAAGSFGAQPVAGQRERGVVVQPDLQILPFAFYFILPRFMGWLVEEKGRK